MRKIMVDKVGIPAMYDQLAEECDELAQKALKASRLLRWENPPRMTMVEIHDGLEEEVADVWICCRELDIEITNNDSDLKAIKEIDEIGVAAMFDRLALNCNKVASDALNISRILRGDDPFYTADEDGVKERFKEMFAWHVSAVWACINVLAIKINTEIVKFKEDRFLKGWEETHNDEQEEA